MKKTLYVVGNSVLPDDSHAVTVTKTMNIFQNFHLKYFDPTESLPQQESHPLFLDTVHGITDITIFSSLVSFKKPPTATLHDYDLYSELLLLTKLKQIEEFTIIGLPNTPITSSYEKKLTDIITNIVDTKS